jgi:hypothetical protein
LTRTFAALNPADRGYNAHSVVTLRVALTDRRFTTTSAVEQFVRTIAQRVTALPGVIDAAATRTLPLESDCGVDPREASLADRSGRRLETCVT